MRHELEALVRSGRLAAARQLLKKIPVDRIAIGDRLAYSNLARRVGMPGRSLRILAPLRERDEQLWSNEEKLEYAASLRSLGIVPEAKRLLMQIDWQQNPLAALHLAFCHMSHWEYEATIPLLESYLASFTEPSYALASFTEPSYAQQVGRINMLQALIFCGRSDQARSLISTLQKSVDPNTQSLVHMKTLELAAQIEVVCEDWDAARRCLIEAQKCIERSDDPLSALFVKKWQAVVDTFHPAASSLALASSLDSNHRLLEVRDEAVRLKHWETVRDCTYYYAKATGDHELLMQLYYGTPYRSFREKVQKTLGPQIELPETWYWQSQLSGSKTPVFDVRRGEFTEGSACQLERQAVRQPVRQLLPQPVRLAVGQSLHRLVLALVRDLYKPQPLLTLFPDLFPEERFNPLTSPNRIRQVMKRLRRWIEAHSLPMELEEVSGSYRLVLTGPVRLALPRDEIGAGGPQDFEFQRLKLVFSARQETFTSREASAALGVSKSSVKRLLKWGVDSGCLQLEGQTNRSRYRFTS